MDGCIRVMRQCFSFKTRSIGSRIPVISLLSLFCTSTTIHHPQRSSQSSPSSSTVSRPPHPYPPRTHIGDCPTLIPRTRTSRARTNTCAVTNAAQVRKPRPSPHPARRTGCRAEPRAQKCSGAPEPGRSLRVLEWPLEHLEQCRQREQLGRRWRCQVQHRKQVLSRL